MDSICAFESKDGQMVALQRVYGLCLPVSAMPAQTVADCTNSKFCSLLISGVSGLFVLRSSWLGDRASSVRFSISGANDDMLQLMKMS